MNNITLIVKYILRSRKDFILAVILMTLSTGFVLAIPLISQQIINGITGGNFSLNNLLFWFVISIVCAILGSVIEGSSRFFTSSAGTKAQYYLRKDLYDSINRQSYKFFDNNEIGDLVARITSDIDNTQMIFNRSAVTAIKSLITLAGVMIGCLLTVPSSFPILLASIAVFFIISFYCYRKMGPAYLKSRKNFGTLTTIVRENLIGANIVRIFNAQDKELGKFEDKNNAFKNDTIETIKWQSMLIYIGRIIINVLVVTALIIGGYQVINQTINIGTLIAFTAFIAMLMMPLGDISNVLIDLVQAMASLTRVTQVIDATSEIDEKSDKGLKKAINGSIEFRNVNFQYMQDTPVLKNINLKVNPGDTVAIIGTTGSGKTTLMNLIPRYYDVTNGGVYVDNTNIKDYNLSTLRNQIGFCSQEVFLFNITIANNIRFGRPEASMNEVIQAAKDANIHDFIMTLPKGYDSIVGERASNLSGGQKQRISIARALILNPKILILDDSTSSVDTETEYKISQALDRLMKNRTSFIITQRVSNLRKANKILVMDKGEIIGQGNHESLYKKNEMYTNIYDTLYKKQKEAELELKKGGSL